MSKLIALIKRAVALHKDISAVASDIRPLAKAMGFVEYRTLCARIVGEVYDVEPHASRTTKLMTFAKDSAPEQCLTNLSKCHPKHEAEMLKRSGQKSNKQEPVSVKRVKVNALCDVFAGMTKQEIAATYAAALRSMSFE